MRAQGRLFLLLTEASIPQSLAGSRINAKLQEGKSVLKQPVQEWESLVGDRYLKFKCEHEKGLTYTLTVDGIAHTVKGGFLSMMFGFDEIFVHDGKDMRLVTAKTGVDIVYDGQLLIADKPYYPRPAWVWVFVVLCLSLVFLAGMLGGFFGFIGAAACMAVSKTGLSVLLRILLCLAISTAVWFAVIFAGVTLNAFVF
ncbi:MAG: hypothetical protein FWC86_04980 [Coriobacteriia bacterium]|nr:hypothetical protein [Coriobacteriia bacterium]